MLTLRNSKQGGVEVGATMPQCEELCRHCIVFHSGTMHCLRIQLLYRFFFFLHDSNSFPPTDTDSEVRHLWLQQSDSRLGAFLLMRIGCRADDRACFSTCGDLANYTLKEMKGTLISCQCLLSLRDCWLEHGRPQTRERSLNVPAVPYCEAEMSMSPVFICWDEVII